MTERKQQDVVGKIEYESALLVRRGMHVSTFDKKYGVLDRSAYLLLRQLQESGPASVKTLADEFHLDISTVSRQAAALEAKGLVTRLSDPTDGRVSLFEITEFGLEQLQATMQTRHERFTRILESWTSEEQEMFGELLARLNRTFLD